MAERLGYPRYDPHGDPIPTATGDLPPSRGLPLTDCPAGWEGRIVHIEDEPQPFYTELVGAGLAPGMRIHVLESDLEGIRIGEATLGQIRRRHPRIAAKLFHNISYLLSERLRRETHN